MRALLRTAVLAGFAPVAFAEPVASVLESTGRWCRGRQELLTAGKPIALTDQIGYCGTTMQKADRITIRFRAPGIRDRSFSCVTPGVCSPGAKLYLGGPRAIPGTKLVSHPSIARTGSRTGQSENVLVVVPDVYVRPEHVHWKNLTAYYRFPVVCSLQAGSLSDCQAAVHSTRRRPGLYAIVGRAERLAGLVLVLNGSGPPRLQNSAGMVTTVVQRDNILNLYDSTMMSASQRSRQAGPSGDVKGRGQER